MTTPPPVSANSAPTELWLLDCEACAAQLTEIEAITPRLSNEDRARAAAMGDRQRAKLWSAGRTALRLLLETRCDAGIRSVAFARAPGGRPHLAGHRIDFSIADSGSFLLIGIAESGPIGVDVERPRELRMSVDRIALILAAAEGLTGTPASPLQAWTRIEAFAKAAGPSLAASLARLGIQGHGEAGLTAAAVRERARHAKREAGIEVLDLDLPHGLVGALASPVAMPQPTTRSLDAFILDRLAH